MAWFFYEGNDLYDDETYENALAYLREHGSYARPLAQRLDLAGFREVSLSVNAFRTLRRALDPLVPVSAPSFFRDSRGATLKLYFHQDAALRLVFVPSKFRVYGARCDFPQGSPCAEWRLWDLQDRFRSFCAREGLPLLDLTGPLRDAAAGGRVLYAPEESHWNAQGHRFVAELLAASLRAR